VRYIQVVTLPTGDWAWEDAGYVWLLAERRRAAMDARAARARAEARY